MSEPAILFLSTDGIATITLNRPDVGNAINEQAVEQLLDAAIRCDLDPEIRCVVITGNGKLFCGGGDIGEFKAAGDELSPYISKLVGIMHMAIGRLMRMPKPLLVLVNGPAAGAGMSLALAGDIVIAARSAHFSTAYSHIGLTADGGMSWQLPRVVGMRKAQDLMMTGRRVASDEALEIGLVTAVVDDDCLAEEGAKRARALAASAVGSIGEAKALLLGTFSESLEAQLEAETRSMVRASMGSECKEGVAAFLEKRKADFRSLG